MSLVTFPVTASRGIATTFSGVSYQDVQALAEACSDENTICVAANDNADGQVVLSGHMKAIEKAVEIASEFGAKRCIKLPVSAPFHSPLMKPAAVALKEKLENTAMHAPQIDVVANVDVNVHKEREAIIDALASQAAGAVQWVKTIQAFKEMGVTHIVECGPGRVLAGLIKRIDSSIVVKNINSQESLAAVLEEINAAE